MTDVSVCNKPLQEVTFDGKHPDGYRRWSSERYPFYWIVDSKDPRHAGKLEEVQRRVKRRGWEAGEALRFITKLSVFLAPHKIGVGLTGSVLTQGRSSHDLDIILFPHDASQYDRSCEVALLKEFGMKLLVKEATVKAVWRKKGSSDTKHVEVWLYRGCRVDVFSMK